MRKAVRGIVIKHQSILLMKRSKFGDDYYTLLGGGIDPGETAEVALVREMAEEASIKVANPKLVFIENAGPKFGTQYIFTCDYVDGDVALHPDSEELVDNQQGNNLYEPIWVPISKLAGLRLLSGTLKQELLKCLSGGFPTEPKLIDSTDE